ncbi:MAG: oxygen-independent coproporphyrinogen III oxidase [Candidatus Krumholzibacteriia bacterium]
MTVTLAPGQLERLNRPGPRYTSYPTVPVWSRDFTAADHAAALDDLARQPDTGVAVYAHHPYCVKRCHYCGCNAAVSGCADEVDRYLDALERELELVTARIGRRRIVQMHWGGGTPNFLKTRQLERAFGMFADRFSFAPDAEISLETDPRVGTPEQAAQLRELGFNRVSLGVQDFSRRVQVAIGRVQPEKLTTSFFRACREVGFESVNVDLVYGLPHQTPELFGETLARAIDLGPDRVACFGYAHVPWARENQRQIDETALPRTAAKFALFQQAVETFTGAGYRWIGLDHFARPDDELSRAHAERRLHRNFMGYTTRPALDLLAFGASGISEVAGRFAQNDADLLGYRESVDRDELPVVRGLRLSDDDRLRRFVILELMCNLTLPHAATVPEFGAPVDELLPEALGRLAPVVAEGLAVIHPDRLEVTELGRYFLRNVAMAFDAYLDDSEEKPLFSRTV